VNEQRKLIWRIVAWPARFWKRFISPFMPPACRFEPTCSVYAAEAIERHGLRGVWLAFVRLLKCQPFHPGGFDPVPGSPEDALGIERLKERLVGFEPRLLEGDRRAAVAVIFRPGAAGAEVLLIHRAEDERDPWSGHLSFPGGRVDPSDVDPRAAALRETLEEVGLDLGVHAKEIGRFSDLTAVAHGRMMGLVIEPFAFELMGSPELSLNSEAQAALWLPLADLVDQSRRSSMAYTIAGREVQLPRYMIGERVLWGLTLRMLDEVIEVLTGKAATDWPEGR